MGFTKWLLKHGPGSPGSAAKFYCKYFIRLATKYPLLHWEDIFEVMYDDRVRTAQMIDPSNKADRLFHKRDKEWMVAFSQGDICLFTFMMLYMETCQFRRGIDESINMTKLNLNNLTLEAKHFDLTLLVIQETARSIIPERASLDKIEYQKRILQFMAEF